jgi:hypothetical protein
LKSGTAEGETIFAKIKPNDVRSAEALPKPEALPEDAVVEALIRLDEQARLEQVYMAVEIACQQFADVQWVDIDLMKFFYGLDPASSPTRELKRLATSFENVQYGRLHKGNCSGLSWRNARHKHIPERAGEWGSGRQPDGVEWVRIRRS